MLLVLPDTTSWYWPVELVPNLRTFVRPDLAVSHDPEAYDPWEKLVWVEVVLRPRAMTVDWSWMSGVVRRLVETVEADSVEADRVEAERDDTERIEAVRVEAVKVEAERVEAVKVETVTVEAVKVEAETEPSAMELV